MRKLLVRLYWTYCAVVGSASLAIMLLALVEGFAPERANANQSGTAQSQPPAPQPEPPGEPAAPVEPSAPTEPAAPLSVEIVGPTVQIIGKLAHLETKETGDVGNRLWVLDKRISEDDVIYGDDNARVAFTAPLPGKYSAQIIEVSRNLEIAHHEVTIDLQPRTALSPDQAMAMPVAKPQPTLLADPEAFLRQRIREVKSTDRRGDQAAIASEIRQTASAMAAGTLATDSLVEISPRLSMRLRGNNSDFAAWQPFWGEVEKLLVTYVNEGVIPRDPATKRPSVREMVSKLTKVAEILESER